MNSIDPTNPLNAVNTDAAPSATDRALLDYLDGLLHDGSDDTISLDLFPAEPAPNFAAHANVTALPTPARPRPMRVVEPLRTFSEPRPFAEPVKPLPLRMPPIAPPITPAAPPVEMAEIPAPPAVIAEVVAAAPVELEILQSPPVSAAVEADQTPMVEADHAHAWAANGRPQWAQQKFECLIFSSGGLKLAVPLVELGSIYPLEREDLTGIFGQIDWFLGLMHAKNGNIRVVDTAQIVMPERYQSEMAEAYRFVVTLSNSDWGLGVDAVVGTEVLDPEAVRWRGERSKRPWLAGTVISQMCALLDVAQLGAMFNQLDRKRS